MKTKYAATIIYTHTHTHTHTHTEQCSSKDYYAKMLVWTLNLLTCVTS